MRIPPISDPFEQGDFAMRKGKKKNHPSLFLRERKKANSFFLEKVAECER